MISRARVVTLFAFLLLLAGAPQKKPAQNDVPLAAPSELEQLNGLQFRLVEGSEDTAAGAGANQVPPASRLAPDVAEKLLARLPRLEQQKSDKQEFALRKQSLPAPQTGQKISESFPPPNAPDTGVKGSMEGPLEVVRYQPEGQVPLAPNLSVTFSEPMVAV